ncbi:MAG: hypothetical protein H7331_04690, partial [Bacteroidia bacterium]|nr:hypothetical protein [Bacteroidia bacterium]
MKKYILPLLLILTINNVVNAQCVTGELLRNPSFENSSPCAAAFNFAFGSPGTPIPNVTDWLGVNDWSPDYYACGGTQFSMTGTGGYDPPMPYPNGGGYIGVLNYNYGGGIGTEPFGQCLTSSLISGQTYTFTFKIAGSTACGALPVDIGIYGTTNCTSMNYSGTQCPSTGGLTLLGLSGVISPNTSNWFNGSITFVAPFNITAIVVGPNCTYPLSSGCGSVGGGDIYYYFDDLSLRGSGTPPTTLAGTNQTVNCATTAVVLNGSASGGAGGYSYSWSPSAGLSNATIATPTATPGSNTNYTLTVTDGNGCSSSSSAFVTVDNAAPSASAGSSQTINCATTSVVLNGSGSGSYSWSPSAGLSNPNIATPTATPGSNTNY